MGTTLICHPGTAPGELECDATGLNYATSGFVVFLFAVFCASWAMKSGRSGLGWFIFGLLLAPLAGLVLLAKTSGDREQDRATRHEGRTA